MDHKNLKISTAVKIIHSFDKDYQANEYLGKILKIDEVEGTISVLSDYDYTHVKNYLKEFAESCDLEVSEIDILNGCRDYVVTYSLEDGREIETLGNLFQNRKIEEIDNPDYWRLLSTISKIKKLAGKNQKNQNFELKKLNNALTFLIKEFE